MTQLSLLTPGSGGIETPTVQERLLARADDPDTSKAAASKVAAHLSESQERALWYIQIYGPGTLREIAEAALDDMAIVDAVALYHELARRVSELRRNGLVRLTGEIREGCRVWEAV